MMHQNQFNCEMPGSETFGALTALHGEALTAYTHVQTNLTQQLTLTSTYF